MTVKVRNGPVVTVMAEGIGQIAAPGTFGAKGGLPTFAARDTKDRNAQEADFVNFWRVTGSRLLPSD